MQRSSFSNDAANDKDFVNNDDWMGIISEEHVRKMGFSLHGYSDQFNFRFYDNGKVN
jgi:hypothetical protein